MLIQVTNNNGSYNSPDNAEIITTIKPPIEITADASFNLKTGFIDVVGLGNSGQDVFILDNPITATINVSYYEQLLKITGADPDGDNNGQYNLGGADNTAASKIIAGVGNGDQFVNNHYVLVLFTTKDAHQNERPTYNDGTHFKSVQLVKEVITVVIDEGTYSSNSIIEHINIKLQAMKRDNYAGVGLGDTTNIGINSYVSWKSLVEKYVIMEAVSPSNPKIVFKRFLGFMPITYSGNFIELNKSGISYYYRQNTTKNAQGEQTGIIADVMIGTPLFAMSNVDDLLAFSYTHNPMYDISTTTGSKTEVIQLESLQKVTSGPFVVQWRMRRGGINIIDLQPRSFWFTILGFDESVFMNITTETTNIGTTFDIVKIQGPNSFDTSTTKPFIGSSDYDQNYGQSIATYYPADGINKQYPLINVNTTITLKAVNAINFSTFNNGGHFLLYLDYGSKIDNFLENDKKQNLIAIMSREYLNDGYISVFGGNITTILPKGTTLSYIRTTIIDPITKETVKNIGINNSFYFELTDLGT